VIEINKFEELANMFFFKDMHMNRRWILIFIVAISSQLWSSIANLEANNRYEKDLELVCDPNLGQRGLGALLEGVRRSTIFWVEILPLVIDYSRARKIAPFQIRQARFEELHVKYAPKVANLALKLRGMFVKSAQVVSSLSMIIPRPYLEALEPLQSEVPCKTFEEFKRILQGELGGVSVDTIFDKIDPKPLGSATIGQAHAARLRDGREVVVKVLRFSRLIML